ncbi:MAG: VOC family protein [Acidimicrobiia bacterium]|nr:VOC family protein [Acidimicrobiia bacterium]
MPHTPIAHFAINAFDLPRAREFYEAVFGWEFSEWGPPGFFQIETGSRDRFARVQGALQERRELVEGTPTIGFECTVAVDDVQVVVGAAVASGGTVLLEPTTIPDVGELAFVRDPEGNVVGVMRYDNSD